MPTPDLTDGKALVRRRHAEWRGRQSRWRWLVDSYEGGDVYRRAAYGQDDRGWPLRNLVRHPREYPSPGDHSGTRITDAHAGTMGTFASGRMSNDGSLGAGADEPQGDDYWTRWWRTPPPTFVQEAVDFQLSRLYSHEPSREGPEAYLRWSEDVDGSGVTVRRWMREEVAWRLLVLGCVDVLCDRPPVDDPAGLPGLLTLAEVERLGLDRVEARLIDPQDVLDWEIDRRRDYVWVLDREYHPSESADPKAPGTAFATRYRYWDRDRWVLFDGDGVPIDEGDHGYGFVPQKRLFTRRQPRKTHVGMSLFEDTAELAREYYNRDSELVLDDANHSHPQLQGDAEAIEAGETVVGPGWLMPIKRYHDGSHIPYSVIDFPHGGAESLRANKEDLRSSADRLNGLARPAGASGTGTVSQSGISKSFDDRRANDLLSRRSDVLADAETQIGRLVVAVAAGGSPAPADLDAVRVAYSKRFDLLDAAEFAERWVQATEALAAARQVEQVEAGLKVYSAMLREDLLRGLPDDDYAELEREARAYLESKPEPPPLPMPGGAMPPATDDDDDESEDDDMTGEPEAEDTEDDETAA